MKDRVEARLWAEVAAGRGGLWVRRFRGATEKRAALLAELARRIAACRRCPLGGRRRNPVPGEGNPNAELVFVGEAPGYEEDQQGRPFVGPAGQLLTRMIEAMGLRREEVFIANVLKCRPPGNRDPEPAEIAACRPFLEEQLQIIRPRVIITLGAHAARWFLGPGARISQVRGRAVDVEDFQIVPTFHPSYLLRRPDQKRKAWADLQVAMKLLGLPLPPPRRAQSRENRAQEGS